VPPATEGSSLEGDRFYIDVGSNEKALSGRRWHRCSAGQVVFRPWPKFRGCCRRRIDEGDRTSVRNSGNEGKPGIGKVGKQAERCLSGFS